MMIAGGYVGVFYFVCLFVYFFTFVLHIVSGKFPLGTMAAVVGWPPFFVFSCCDGCAFNVWFACLFQLLHVANWELLHYSIVIFMKGKRE